MKRLRMQAQLFGSRKKTKAGCRNGFCKSAAPFYPPGKGRTFSADLEAGLQANPADAMHSEFRRNGIFIETRLKNTQAPSVRHIGSAPHGA
jgi:hypothetical protein